MNKRLKEILKEYEERKHKIIKGDESMNIVVLAGGTSTEREISIVTGTGVCKALRKKGHNAILVDIFCGLEPVDWDEPFGDKDYEADSAAEYMRSFDDDIECTGIVSGSRHCIYGTSRFQRRGWKGSGNLRSSGDPLHRNRIFKQCPCYG